MQGAAAWFTANVWPPAEIVAVRGVVFGLAATLKFTVPVPVRAPLPPTVSHEALLVGVHEQPPPVLTVNDPLPVPEGIDWPDGLIVYEQGAPACCTLKVNPPTEIVPLRGDVLELAPML